MILNPGDIGALKRGDLASLEVDGCSLEWVPEQVGTEQTHWVGRKGYWTMKRPGATQHIRGKITRDTLSEMWRWWLEEAPHRKVE